MAQELHIDQDGIQPISDRHQVAVVVEAVVRATASWGLSASESAALIDVPASTWSLMKSSTFAGDLDRDKVTRASLIIGIHNDICLLFQGPLTTTWPTLTNRGELFGGRRPVDLMISGGIPAMVSVRQHIDALRRPRPLG
jgi:hypothetical protein